LDFSIGSGPAGLGTAVAILDVDEKKLNPNVITHGGVIFNMFNTAMGWATMSVIDEGSLCPPVEVSVRYLRPMGGRGIGGDRAGAACRTSGGAPRGRRDSRGSDDRPSAAG